MQDYKFTNVLQDEYKQKQVQKNKMIEKQTKGKKLLKEATFSVITIDDAILAIQQCMELIAMKKRDPRVFLDLITSSIIGGIDQISKQATDDVLKADKLSSNWRNKIVYFIRNSVLGQ